MDECGRELTFSLLDELARATVRARVAAKSFWPLAISAASVLSWNCYCWIALAHCR
jgi:hypothetical protein